MHSPFPKELVPAKRGRSPITTVERESNFLTGQATMQRSNRACQTIDANFIEIKIAQTLGEIRTKQRLVFLIFSYLIIVFGIY
jgi:hypothetical protein